MMIFKAMTFEDIMSQQAGSSPPLLQSLCFCLPQMDLNYIIFGFLAAFLLYASLSSSQWNEHGDMEMLPAESSDVPFLICDGNNSSDNYKS